MILRPQHFAAFEKVSRKQFEDNMIVHLRKAFKEQTEPMSDDDLRRLVQEGMVRAEKYKVENKDDVRRYLDCMMIYGNDFDTNPKTHWAGQILRTPSLTGAKKMDAVEEFGKRQA